VEEYLGQLILKMRFYNKRVECEISWIDNAHNKSPKAFGNRQVFRVPRNHIGIFLQISSLFQKRYGIINSCYLYIEILKNKNVRFLYIRFLIISYYSSSIVLLRINVYGADYPYFLSLNKFLMCFNYTSSLLPNEELTFSSHMNMQTAIVTKQYIYYIAYDNVQ